MTLRIAVLGTGRAGRARVRGIEAHPETELAAVVRRHPGPGEFGLDQVIDDASIDALIVCTPNLLHPAAARAGLESGKHVAVEFPLAPRLDRAQELFAAARARERVLHVEHIELLAPSQAFLRERAPALGRPIGGSLRFTGAAEGWIDDPALAGSAALRAVARLHRLVDLFGEAQVKTARHTPGAGAGYALEVELSFDAGGELTLIEERRPGLARGTEWDVRCENDPLPPPPKIPPGELFQADLDIFVASIREGASSYVSEHQVLHVLGLVEQIEAACAGKL